MHNIPHSVIQQYPDLLELLANPVIDRCFGAVFGAFVGDALGSFCQFHSGQLSQGKMDEVMKMPGGGLYQTAPGQLTDDGELIMHLLEGLLEWQQNNIEKTLSNIRDGYVRWLQTQPFDIGHTCLTAFTILRMEPNLKQAQKLIKQHTSSSLSNGYLMRIVPMAVFSACLQVYRKNTYKSQIISSLIKSEIQLSHGNEVCLESGHEWVQMMTDIILRHHNLTTIQHKYNRMENCSQFAQWKQASRQSSLMAATPHEGFAKIAYSYGLFQLRQIVQKYPSQNTHNGQLYARIIRQTIQQGGDTDTNASIVGGLIGSIVGFRALPAQYIHPMLTLNLQSSELMHPRPTFYQPKTAINLLIRLLRKFQK